VSRIRDDFEPLLQTVRARNTAEFERGAAVQLSELELRLRRLIEQQQTADGQRDAAVEVALSAERRFRAESDGFAKVRSLATSLSELTKGPGRSSKESTANLKLIVVRLIEAAEISRDADLMKLVLRAAEEATEAISEAAV